MTAFQHIAAEGRVGPHVTLLAGTELAGRYWATTSASAAKVGMIRRAGRAAVLLSDADSATWSMIAGRAVVLDPSRPRDGLADPVAAGLAGLALARIGVANWEQLLGYVTDRGVVPDRWSPTARVILVVHEQDRLAVRDGEIVTASGRFARSVPLPTPTRRRRRRVSGADEAELSQRQIALVERGGLCAVGLSTSAGPVVLPGRWDAARRTVSVTRAVLEHLAAELPGPCTVTLDLSHDARPSAKVGVMLRGDAVLLRLVDDEAELDVRVRSITSWDGFAAASTDAA